MMIGRIEMMMFQALAAKGKITAQRVLHRPRFEVNRKNGIMPPLKDMVRVINSDRSVLNINCVPDNT